MPVVLYGFETWSLTLREESRLRVFENRILRRIFGPKRDENGEWRRLHNEELHSLQHAGCARTQELINMRRDTFNVKTVICVLPELDLSAERKLLREQFHSWPRKRAC